MKALTLTQPYASLVAIGAKRLETRSWRTRYRGPLLIHAGAGLGPVGGERGLLELCDTEPFRAVLGEAFRSDGFFAHPIYVRDHLPRAAIVAVCELVDVLDIGHAGDLLPGYNVPPQEVAFGDYTAGRYAWVLDEVRALDEPVPCRGQLGLWTPRFSEAWAP